MERLTRRILPLLLSLALCLVLLPVTAGAVDYIGADGKTTSVESATSVADQTSWGTAGQTSWYVVNNDVTISSRVTVSGNVNLILGNEATLTTSAGITVAQGNSFTIYAQSTGNSKGQLIAGVSGTIAGNHAGIGGVWDSSSPGTPGTSGTITINGGNVTAQGGSMGAGIGGGNMGSGTVNINGGTVTATGGENGAGIGGGNSAGGGTIMISGGTVTATGGSNGAGIGGGCYGAGGNVSIMGGTVTATGKGYGEGIGAAYAPGTTGTSHGTCSISGSAVVFASAESSNAIGNTSGSDNWNGIVFQGNSGQVYGDVTLEDDLTIPDGKTLTVPGGSTLTIEEGVTVTGSITNNGTVNNSGTVTGGVSGGTVKVPATVSVSADPITATYGETITISGTVSRTASNLSTNDLTQNQVGLFLDDTQIGSTTTVNSNDSFTLSYNTAVKAIPATGQPQTLTVKYGGSSTLMSGEATVSVTLNKKEVTAQVQGDITKVYDGKTSATVSLSFAEGAILANDVVTVSAPHAAYANAGVGDNISITLGTLTVDGVDKDWYTVSAPADVTGSITQGGSSLTVSPSSTSLTYGDTLTIKVTPSSAEQTQINGINTLTEPDTVALIYNGNVLATAETADENGTYTLTYHTTGRGIPVGASTLTVSYGGSTNLAASETTVTVSLSAKPVTASVDGTPSKTYDGGTGITVALAVHDTATGGSFTGTVSGSFADANAGTGKAITLGNDPVWTGAAAGFYRITLPTGVTGEITRATPTLTLTADPTALTGGGAVTLTLTGLPEGEHASVTCDNGVTVTAGSGSTWTATLPNATQTCTFTASYEGGGNYNGAAAACTVEVTYRPSSGGGGGSSSRPARPAGPCTDGSRGWSGIRDEISAARDGGTITVDMNGTTEVPAAIFQEVAGKDVDVIFQLDGGISWTVNGLDVPERAGLRGLDLGVEMGTSGIPVDVVNAVTGGVDSVQITLAHDGEFGFTMTLTAPLGRENRGLWANLYHYDPDSGRLAFETAAVIGGNGCMSLRLSHASQYAILIDETSHDPAAAEPEPLPFTDVAEGAWYYDAVAYVYENGLMAGTGGGAFRPDCVTTRGQIVTILWRMAGSPAADCLMDYGDVAGGSWYAEAVRWAAAQGIVSGYGNGLFGPDDPVTREQMAVMLFRFAQNQALPTAGRADLSAYADAGLISSYALPALRWACAEGLLTGTSGTSMDPTGQTSRAQTAVILMRFCAQHQ